MDLTKQIEKAYTTVRPSLLEDGKKFYEDAGETSDHLTLDDVFTWEDLEIGMKTVLLHTCTELLKGEADESVAE